MIPRDFPTKRWIAFKWTTLTCGSLLMPLLIAGCAKYKVIHASQSLEVNGGASYYLPKLEIVTAIPIDREVSERGDFAFYSRPLLGIPAYIEDGKEVSYSIGKDVSFDYAGIRDEDQQYVALYPRGMFKTFGQTLNLNPEGVMTTGNSSVEDKTVDFVVSTIEGASKIAAASINPAGAKSMFIPTDRKGMKELTAHLNTMDTTGAPLQVKTLAFGLTLLLEQDPDNALAEMKASIAGIPALEQKIAKSKAEGGNDDLRAGMEASLAKAKELQSEIAANEDDWTKFTDDRPKAYRDVRMATEAFKTLKESGRIGGSTRDAGDHRLAKEDYAKTLARFIDRKKEKATTVVQVRWTPRNRTHAPNDKDQVKDCATILKLGSKKGVISSVRPLDTFPAILTKEGAADGDITELVLECTGKVPAKAEEWEELVDEKKARGWHYRIPAKGTVTLKVGGSVQAQRDAYVAQYGCVAFVAATAANQKIVSNIDLDPITGGLKSVTHGGQAFDPAIMSRTGAAAASVIDAQDARKAATAEAIDQKTLLQRRKDILQLKKDIAELESQVTP